LGHLHSWPKLIKNLYATVVEPWLGKFATLREMVGRMSAGTTKACTNLTDVNATTKCRAIVNADVLRSNAQRRQKEFVNVTAFLFAQQFSLPIDMKPCYLGLANFLGGNIRAIRKRSVKSRQRLL
jgi:hypothetical protein